ncbi:MAG: tRNA uridine-5-carboxymethylaminomethyl(34) synthesis GTPase MnmE [Opitutaceae bacterium]
MLPFTDTIAALATPVGVSALAVIRVSGPDTAGLVDGIFGRSPPPRSVKRADYRGQDASLIDEVLFTFFRSPNSYTGEDSVEISCHGNPFIAQKIVEDLLARGCRAAGPGEFTQRAFLNGKMDLSQAEAVMDLIHAQSDRALVAANHQLRGALGRKMELLVERLLGVIARVEAYIDFPEEDLPAEDNQWIANELAELTREVEQLQATSHYGALLRDGIKTVILGAPNAGKSSLLNRLIGRDRALVSAEPGTTRDFLEERIILGAHSLRLIDTAGLNPSPAPLEKMGIQKTLERAQEADLFLHVIDAATPAPVLPEELSQRISAVPTIVVLNKIDLLPDSAATADHDGKVVLRVSALHNTGMEELVAALNHQAETFQRTVGTDVIAINARHSAALDRAKKSLVTAKAKLAATTPTELLASDLRDVLLAMEEIVGKVDGEKMLDQLFAKFCIGK